MNQLRINVIDESNTTANTKQNYVCTQPRIAPNLSMELHNFVREKLITNES